MWNDPRFLIRWSRLHAEAARHATGSLERAAVRWQYGLSKHRRRGKAPRPVVLYSQVAWDDVWQRPQEMARGLARRGRPVLFVSPVQVHQAAGPMHGRWRPVRIEEGGRLMILAPLILTGEYRSPAVRGLNRANLSRLLLPFIKGTRAILMTNSPFIDDLAVDHADGPVMVDLIDDFCAFDWAPEDARLREKRLLDRARLVIAGTDQLARTYSAELQQDVEYLPSGVDVEKLTKPADEPRELRGLPRPRLLYVGTLNDRLDGELIARTAREFPDASVVIVGPRRATFRAPRFPGNVHEMGLRPHDELPGFYQHCDVGLMPFADNEAARAINPVKTLEYLACGLPVISTPIPDVRRFYEPPVVVAEPRDWPARMRAMITGNSDEARNERARFAQGRSWSALIERLDTILAQLEGEA